MILYVFFKEGQLLYLYYHHIFFCFLKIEVPSQQRKMTLPFCPAVTILYYAKKKKIQ